MEMFSDNADKIAQISSGEQQLKLYSSFLEMHDTLLNKLSNQNDERYDAFYCTTIDQLTEKLASPIQLQFSDPYEDISLFQLVESENKVLNKIIITFAQLCEEADILKQEAYMHQMKFLFVDEDLCAFEGSKQNEQCYIKISNYLEFLCSILYLIDRCIDISIAIVHQLGALFSQDYQLLDSNLTLQFKAVYDKLNTIAVQLIIFDDILSNSNFYKSWSSYKNTMHSVVKNIEKFDYCSQTEINGLLNMLSELEILFSGALYQRLLDKLFKLKESISAKSMGILSGHYQDYIKNNLTTIESFSTDLSDFDETLLIIKMNAACVLYHNYFGQLDQKCYKRLLDINGKHLGITLIGNRVWCPEPFLKKYTETLLKGNIKYSTDSTKQKQVQLQSKVQNILRDGKDYCLQVTSWSVQMNGLLQSENYDLKLRQFTHRCNIFLQGTQLAGQLSHMIKSLTNMHVILQIPMQKSTLMLICKLIEHLQIIQLTFNSNIENVAKTVQCVMQYLQYKVLFIIQTAKKKITHDSYNEHNLDVLSALQIAERCMFGPATKKRILTTNLTMNVATSNRCLPSEHLKKVEKLLYKLDFLCDLQQNLSKLCDTIFIYWHQSILSVYLRKMLENGVDYHALSYLLKSADDCRKTFQSLDIDNLKLVEIFKKSNSKQFKSEIIDKLCAEIETFLRLEVHTNLQLENTNPFTNPLTDYRNLITLRPILINGEYLVLKDHVENYLCNMFYNLTTISLHDWKTYREMRHLASYKFNLNIVEDYLPTQTLEQGIDVLEIIRNFHIFVSKYLYNINNQIFIESSSNNKHLNTIGIRHISNSLRTHGTGIINTTVNCTYKFLKRKFKEFSQFMYDEHIKSRLSKDLKYFRDSKENQLQMYCYDRADKFNKGIRKLGLTPDGQSCLDRFRQLITNIGNTMGYIRLIRSGGIHANINASIYLPKLDDNLEFSKIAKDNNLSPITIQAAENLENSIKNLSGNFFEGSEYFRILVDAFSSSLRDPQNMHLRNFYLIVPPLMINFVEYMINAKDKINKKDKQGALFVDDGFAIGLTYILKLLDQMSAFDSLHWFKSVEYKYATERQKIINQLQEVKAASYDEKLQQALSLTEKRIDAHQIEFNLLQYNLVSSKIFFE